MMTTYCLMMTSQTRTQKQAPQALAKQKRRRLILKAPLVYRAGKEKTMMNFTEVKKGTKMNARIKAAASSYGYGSIYEAYEKPSYNKVREYDAIERRAKQTDGYHGNLTICSKNTFSFSTVYTYTDNGVVYGVMDTPTYTYRTVLN